MSCCLPKENVQESVLGQWWAGTEFGKREASHNTVARCSLPAPVSEGCCFPGTAEFPSWSWQVNIVPNNSRWLFPVSSWLQGIKELKPMSFLSIYNTCLRTTSKLEEGWAKMSSSWGEHIRFPFAMWSLEKYIGLDNIITKEESFFILTCL